MARPRMDIEAQRAVRQRVTAILRADPDHPLFNALIDPSTDPKRTPGAKGPPRLWGASSHLGEAEIYDRPAVDVSHKHYGKGDQAQFGIEFASENREVGLHGGENVDVYMDRQFLDVTGPRGGTIPVDAGTLKYLETGANLKDELRVPPGTMAAAPPSQGWRAQDVLSPARFARLQAELQGTQLERHQELHQFVDDPTAGSPPAAAPLSAPSVPPDTPPGLAASSM